MSAAAQNRGFDGEETRDGECRRRIAGVTGSLTRSGRTVGGGAETPIETVLDTAGATNAEYSYSNMMH
jgi:hypothetical protein